jgi:hypothetical protein
MPWRVVNTRPVSIHDFPTAPVPSACTGVWVPATEGLRIHVQALEALDKSHRQDAVIDIKPVLDPAAER